MQPRSKEELINIGANELQKFVALLSAEVGWKDYEAEKIYLHSKEEVDKMNETERNF